MRGIAVLLLLGVVAVVVAGVEGLHRLLGPVRVNGALPLSSLDNVPQIVRQIADDDLVEGTKHSVKVNGIMRAIYDGQC